MPPRVLCICLHPLHLILHVRCFGRWLTIGKWQLSSWLKNTNNSVLSLPSIDWLPEGARLMRAADFVLPSIFVFCFLAHTFVHISGHLGSSYRFSLHRLIYFCFCFFFLFFCLLRHVTPVQIFLISCCNTNFFHVLSSSFNKQLANLPQARSV